MPVNGGGYGAKGLAGETTKLVKRQAARQVSYNNTKLRPRRSVSDRHLGTVAPLPNPKG